MRTTPEIKILRKDGQLKKFKITSSKDAEIFFREIFDEDSLEVFEQVMAIFLDTAGNTVGWFKVSQGGLSASIVDVRLLFRAALDCLATGIILAHNHPSGNLARSKSDDLITEKIKEAGSVLDIKLIDHLILTNESYYSYDDAGNL